MERIFQAFVAASILAVSFAGSAIAGPFENAVFAYMAGDYATAIQLMRAFAEQGDAPAQYNLGLMYDNGRGVPRDYAAAVQWYRKAAEQGHAGAQYNLGLMYDSGQGVPQDYAAALSWLRKAAEQSGTGGAGLAQVNLGRMYAKGRGVPQDYVTAHMWFSLAAARGVEKAVKDREIVAAQMTPAQIAEAQKLAGEVKPE
jgi:uncharacterized protein